LKIRIVNKKFGVNIYPDEEENKREPDLIILKNRRY
jgi:hypothetical protein